MNLEYSLFSTTPLNMEDLLGEELRSFGASDIEIRPSGAAFRGDLELIYRICLASRTANRVLLSLGTFPGKTPKELYKGALAIPWDTYFPVNKSIKIHADVRNSEIRHSHYASQVVKDGIADYFKEKTGSRPSVNTTKPDVSIRLFLKNNKAHLSLDLSGKSLSRRGYRKKKGAAPLKENTAAAMLLRAGWPDLAEKECCLVDPMCGSGTILIEAALMAAGIAPGIFSRDYGFRHLNLHVQESWDRIRREYEKEKEKRLDQIPGIYGYDMDPLIVETARENCRRAGLEGYIRIEKGELKDIYPPKECSFGGLVITNPPYGVRIGDNPIPNFITLGRTLKERFDGWQATVITLNKAQSKAIGLKAFKTNSLYNGNIQCFLAHFSIDESNKLQTAAPAADPGAEMLLNRLKKNRKRLSPWIKKNNITCYRLYDADMPEYNAAVDIYEQSWVLVQEYAPPAEIEPEKARSRLAVILSILPGFLDIPQNRIVLKQRKKQRGDDQYGKRDGGTSELTIVREGGLKFYINAMSYIDSGLFLDHRETRALIRNLAEGKRFLNLFSYTASATVYAAAGGASSTTSVDQSNTYSDWGRRNLFLNGFTGKGHSFVVSDSISWLETNRSRFDLIFIDPPTFSNRKGGRRFAVQEDHTRLIELAARCLTPEGIIIFSTNYRKFRMEEEKLPGLTFENITDSTIPFDFSRNKKIHFAWLITKKGKSNLKRIDLP
jgi:23S rRNA (guanine2445-N2)-methyltransferase / 23S rRNA (guanine2069-N7)-methyltransferase